MNTVDQANPATLWQDVERMLVLEQKPLPAAVPIARRRRRAFSPEELDVRTTLQLLSDSEGVLRWSWQAPVGGPRGRRRSYRAAHVEPSTLVTQFRFHELGGNQITQGLQFLDAKLNPDSGLRRWNGTVLEPISGALKKGRVLVLVHGTFSKSRMYFDELTATGAGLALLAKWQGAYAEILAFDHATLSVGAWSNAVDLMNALKDIEEPMDMICHSRGGLVVSWMLRLRELPVEKVVFVGSPLTGTSLASPARMRAALDMMANFADATARLGASMSTVMPLAAGAAGLARILGNTLRLPVADAAVSMVPGLASQQRTSNNLEIHQLFAAQWQTAPRLAAVGGYFQPDESREEWKFWKRFTHVTDQLKYSAADMLFDGPNDLVVDVKAMAQLGEKAVISDFHDLGTSSTTHHTNYFRDSKVLKFLDAQLA